ncbi:hypothetical protein TL16_g05401 [Triparma laevis f. inornata]|uniref:Carbohydrate kinase PfkB domain-containing protein n=2 Tax=Triparma laevis TaxID=1534972 RepID=A0A9W7E6N0_9STRA|nr:hypothetical protein TrLO_g1842 [Triparma laevis f. longispina]GMH70416.1 hypothetical protein TL16_g05401 [Triparma laevis f. inornata]
MSNEVLSEKTAITSTPTSPSGRPIIALESTIVSHGMPYPQNLHTALSVESIIRDGGCTPATLALNNGHIKLGLELRELEDLSRSGTEGRATKCTTRELGVILNRTKSDAESLWGSTTVASTMHLAEMASIDFFVTGGTGGVHRDYNDSLDVSADLTELARTNTTVFSAGVKSILDVPRTLEFLETEGVTVGVFGSDEFPAFFSPKSGCRAPLTFESYREVAEAIRSNQKLYLDGGFLLTCPNPEPLENVDEAVETAVREVTENGILGKEVTPYILKRVAELTDGNSLASNIALVENNAKIGAGVAKAYQELMLEEEEEELLKPKGLLYPKFFGKVGGKDIKVVDGVNFLHSDYYNDDYEEREERGEDGVDFDDVEEDDVDFSDMARMSVVIMGGAVVDVVARPTTDLKLGTSNPVFPVEFFSAAGNDTRGASIKTRLESRGVKTHLKLLPYANTASYLAVMDSQNDLHTAIADMAVLSHIPTPPIESLRHASCFILDANPPVSSMKLAIEEFLALGNVTEEAKTVVFEPTSVDKARGVAEAGILSMVHVMTPNRDEAIAMASVLGLNVDGSIEEIGERLLEEMNTDVDHRGECVATILLTDGVNGVLLLTKAHQGGGIRKKWFKPEVVKEVENATAAGDSFLGGFITHAILTTDLMEVDANIFGGDEAALDKSVEFGMACSEATIGYKGTISKEALEEGELVVQIQFDAGEVDEE